MNKKNVFKLILDFCMVIVLVLMYNKNSINITFHEIGGLAILGVFLIHILINYKWVVDVTKKLFSKGIAAKTKFGYIINVFLLVSLILIGVSGIMISKVVFHFSILSSLPWKTIHYTSSALALIFIGIHIGLHKKFICSNVSQLIPIPKKVSRILGIVITIIIVTYGCYSMYSTSFTKWLLLPFSTTQSEESFEGKQMFDNNNGNNAGGDTASRPERPDDGRASDTTDSNNSNNTSSDKQGFPTDGDRPSMDGNMKPDGMGQSSGIATVLSTIINFFSISFVFAAITAIIEAILSIIKKKKAPEAVTSSNTANEENTVDVTLDTEDDED